MVAALGMILMNTEKHYALWLAGANCAYRTKEASECTLLVEISDNPWNYAHVAINPHGMGEGFGYDGDYWA